MAMKERARELDGERIERAVRELGSQLRARQPRRALPDLAGMGAELGAASQLAMNGLRELLGQVSPGTAVFCASDAPSQESLAEHAAYWWCDPIDGGVQYLSGLTLWSLSLCLVAEGRTEFALTHDPISGDVWRARRGEGLWRNGEPAFCGERAELSLAVLGASFPNYPQRPAEEIASHLARLGLAMPHVLAQRWMGPASISLSQAGAGVLDGYWEVGSQVMDWLAGALLAEEGGCVVTDLDGKPLAHGANGILAACPALHGRLLALLQGGVV
ncbi:inositol monophosphatase family protein [Chromobacterium sp. IIBBL 290-4]|uniref:inositol monophosphatase family protein n=1 Tax=Chromobacterium sp. IIBBL 290-4 TaxID=2953890 RepID=UPI0020B8E247|nr:inositol monophosphatase family protein [Chromobacterium sp. IIBBL 290-4]UTH74778.1 inositol monophosphatase family protein [Chromobacterium sp. IIBBL 290-4]